MSVDIRGAYCVEVFEGSFLFTSDQQRGETTFARVLIPHIFSTSFETNLSTGVNPGAELPIDPTSDR